MVGGLVKYPDFVLLVKGKNFSAVHGECFLNGNRTRMIQGRVPRDIKMTIPSENHVFVLLMNSMI
jgi:hypothetical protein